MTEKKPEIPEPPSSKLEFFFPKHLVHQEHQLSESNLEVHKVEEGITHITGSIETDLSKVVRIQKNVSTDPEVAVWEDHQV